MTLFHSITIETNPKSLKSLLRIMITKYNAMTRTDQIIKRIQWLFDPFCSVFFPFQITLVKKALNFRFFFF